MGLVEGKIAIVTGGGANIGEACARMLAAHGAQVVIADVNADGARQVANDICSGGGKAVAQSVDIADEDSIATLIEAVTSQFGRIDILHNNAANTAAAQMMRDDEDAFRARCKADAVKSRAAMPEGFIYPCVFAESRSSPAAATSSSAASAASAAASVGTGLRHDDDDGGDDDDDDEVCVLCCAPHRLIARRRAHRARRRARRRITSSRVSRLSISRVCVADNRPHNTASR